MENAKIRHAIATHGALSITPNENSIETLDMRPLRIRRRGSSGQEARAQ